MQISTNNVEIGFKKSYCEVYNCFQNNLKKKNDNTLQNRPNLIFYFLFQNQSKIYTCTCICTLASGQFLSEAADLFFFYICLQAYKLNIGKMSVYKVFTKTKFLTK